jgi:hypothetical protein
MVQRKGISPKMELLLRLSYVSVGSKFAQEPLLITERLRKSPDFAYLAAVRPPAGNSLMHIPTLAGQTIQ